MVNKKNSKKKNPSDHSPLEEDGQVFEDPWMWEDEEQAKTDWQQGTAPDLTPRDGDDGS